MKKILFIPIDNRPITYDLTMQITKVNKNLNLVMPNKEFLGGLIKNANISEILNFIKNEKDEDLIILSLDTVCYGGLVSSRRGNETFDELKNRLLLLEDVLKDKKYKNPNLKIYATSSIMRISNNNVNEEEKTYWDKFGKEIYKYSYFLHKEGKTQTEIPNYILEDYLNTRKRNFNINKIYLEWLKNKLLDFLIYSKDDTGEFGLNVKEGHELQDEINKYSLPAIVKTGADEIPLGLLLRGVAGDTPLKIKIIYKYPDSIDKISRYEDISVKKCIEEQIKIGVKNSIIVENNPNIILYVNNFETKQGDLVFQDIINKNTNFPLEFNKPFIIADINNANGSDEDFVENILDKKYNDNFLSYSGYNTSANTIGSALCLGIFTYFAKKENSFDENIHKKVLAIRFLDDWGYQAKERIKVQNSIKEFNNLDFSYYENRIKKFLDFEFCAKYKLPWNRSFEIEVDIK